MVGFDSGNALFDVAEETGGAADAIVPSHTHTATSVSTVTDPTHSHTMALRDGAGGNPQAPGHADGASWANPQTATAATGITVCTSTTVATAGVSPTNTNYQPYITVYMFKRTA